MVNESAKRRSEPAKTSADTAGTSDSDKSGSQEKAALLPESEKTQAESKSMSQKGRGHLMRQDADNKPGSK